MRKVLTENRKGKGATRVAAPSAQRTSQREGASQKKGIIMAKAAHTNGQGGNGRGDVHFMLQGKGGVGKSTCASFLTQYLLSKGRVVQGFDSDMNNLTFASYEALPVEQVKVTDGDGHIDVKGFDKIYDTIEKDARTFVVDSGANSFKPLWDYMLENETLAALEAAGHRVFIHTVVHGGSMLVATLSNVQALAATLTGRNLVVWVNEHLHPAEIDGKVLGEMKAFKEFEPKVLGTVLIKKRTAHTFGDDMEKMLTGYLTFEEALAQPERFGSSSRQRLTVIRRGIFEQLDQLPFGA